MEPIRVLIADDHQLIIDGLCSLLKEVEHISVVDTANTGEDVIKKLASKKVDIVLMDISMPGMDGMETTEYISNHHPDTKVIALSMHNQVSYIVKMLKHGAKGYLLKHISKAGLIEAIETVYDEGIYYSPEVAVHLVNKLFKDGVSEVFPSSELTEREIEIVKLIVTGEPNKIIADKLSITEATVKTHRQRILAKLQLKNTPELINYAYKHNIL